VNTSARLRARRRVQGADTRAGEGQGRQQKTWAAFPVATRNGQFGALLALLEPEVVPQAAEAVLRMGAAAEVLGASAVAETLSGRAKAAVPVSLRGGGARWAADGLPRVVSPLPSLDGHCWSELGRWQLTVSAADLVPRVMARSAVPPDRTGRERLLKCG
jgi:hypothetical protein